MRCTILIFVDKRICLNILKYYEEWGKNEHVKINNLTLSQKLNFRRSKWCRKWKQNIIHFLIKIKIDFSEL